MTTINPGAAGKGLDFGPLVVRPNKAMQLLDCSRVYLYQLINGDGLESYRDGAARKITMRSIYARIERKVRETQQQTA
jgi:hypothetical protein